MSDTTILVFTDQGTSRETFTLRFVLEDVLGLHWQVSTDAEAFEAWNGPKFSYCRKAVGEELHFYANDLLRQTGHDLDQAEVGKHNEQVVLFPHGNRGALPFDLFAATFYLITRYEEYQPHALDQYQRFPASASLAHKHNFLQQPVVDQWAMLLKSLLLERFPTLTVPPRSYRFVTTIDVDNAYEYLEKGLMRTMGAYARSVLRFNTSDLKERTRALLGMDADAYDTFEHLYALEEKYGLQALYFFLVGDYGLNDKNVPISSRKFQSLIKTIGDRADIGIHPSFNSNHEPHRLGTEIGRLSKVLHTPIRKSRQHFLKLNFPTTYRQLIEREITEDYTMGYASELGFRAGTCTPFRFYDLHLEQETGLRVFPFCTMEATLKYYKNVPPERAMEHLKPVIDAVKAVNGTYMSLWHNDSLSDTKHWKGWKDVYEAMIQYASA